MAVKKEEKMSLNKMWNKASVSATNVAAGKYMFKIESAKYYAGEKGPSIKEMLKITGGNEEYIGETISQFDNLATEQNMSFFKQKLQRLGIDIPEDFTEIEDGTVCEQMEGLTFEGELKIKNGFVNIYVTKLVDDDEDFEEDEDAEEDSEEESNEEGTDEEDTDAESEEDDEAENTDEEESEDVEEAEESDEDEEEEDDSEEGSEFPTPDEVAVMKAKQVNEILSAIDLDPKEIASPKKVLEGISNYLYTPKYTPEIDVFNMVVKALNVKGLKGKTSADKNKLVRQAVNNLLS